MGVPRLESLDKEVASADDSEDFSSPDSMMGRGSVKIDKLNKGKKASREPATGDALRLTSCQSCSLVRVEGFAWRGWAEWGSGVGDWPAALRAACANADNSTFSVVLPASRVLHGHYQDRTAIPSWPRNESTVVRGNYAVVESARLNYYLK